MKVGTFFDIDIYVNKILVVAMAMAIFTGHGARITTIFLAMFIHEMCHVIAAHMLNLKVQEIELLPFGGAIRIESIFEINPRNEIIISAAGPISNLVVIIIYNALENIGVVMSSSAELFLKSNIMLAGFNILPALPLDGGRILRAALCKQIGFKKATNVATNGGIVLSIFLIATGIYAAFNQIFNITLFLAGFFLMYSAFKEKRIATYVFLRDITYKKDILLKEGVLPVRSMVVLYSMPLKEVIKNFTPHQYHNIQIVDEHMKVKGILTESQIVKGVMNFNINVPIGRLLNK